MKATQNPYPSPEEYGFITYLLKTGGVGGRVGIA
jgi:hypothetical protein